MPKPTVLSSNLPLSMAKLLRKKPQTFAERVAEEREVDTWQPASLEALAARHCRVVQGICALVY